MENVRVKQEIHDDLESVEVKNQTPDGASTSGAAAPPPLIDLCSSESSGSDSDSSSSSSSLGVGGVSEGRGSVARPRKRRRVRIALPEGFLDPLPRKVAASTPAVHRPLQNWNADVAGVQVAGRCKQFWKAGDFEGPQSGDWNTPLDGMDHVRVHPKFLHSNATSHKWVLGAFAELLDNAMDEVCNGATHVCIDMVTNKKDGSRMLLIEDNGGGMDPDKIRQCMSLGYSLKSKLANTIGQYGNGFKTSTMRLGADVIVFSRCRAKKERRATQSIGLLSYTFLRSTGKEDIVVPMLDYEREGERWSKLARSSATDWNINVEAIVRWSPFSSEADLLRQFNQMKDQGTRIIIYNLWEDEQGLAELDFDADVHDIQIRGVNRDEQKIQMARQYPNSSHYLTYRHSLRSYASILYLRIPPGFQITLRGKEVEHHNVVNDLMMTKQITYRPQQGVDGVLKDRNMVAELTIGFVKDARFHIDVQGFNVYHKNRLIKPFWKIWHSAGSDGRGVIGVLEANFIEPAHDKQGFEHTIVLSRLETRLVQFQKNFWYDNCHKIGYAPRRDKKSIVNSIDYIPPTSQSRKERTFRKVETSLKRTKVYPSPTQKQNEFDCSGKNKGWTSGIQNSFSKHSSSYPEQLRDDDAQLAAKKLRDDGAQPDAENLRDDGAQPAAEMLRDDGAQPAAEKLRHDGAQPAAEKLRHDGAQTAAQLRHDGAQPAAQLRHDGARTAVEHLRHDGAQPVIHDQQLNGLRKGNDYGNEVCSQTLDQLKKENQELKKRLRKKENDILSDMLHDLLMEKDKCKSLEAQLQEATQKIKDLNNEQENLIDIFSEERERRDIEEENLRKKLKEATNSIQELLNKLKILEKEVSYNGH